MSTKTVLYRPVKLRYARNGAIFGIVMLLLHYATGQADALVYQGPMEPWLFHLMVAAFVILICAACGYAIGWVRDRNNPGPTERIAVGPVRRRWAIYGGIAGIVIAVGEYFHLFGSAKLEPWTGAFTTHDGVSAVVTISLLALICYVFGCVRDSSSG